jgi:hypothetical protein
VRPWCGHLQMVKLELHSALPEDVMEFPCAWAGTCHLQGCSIVGQTAAHQHGRMRCPPCSAHADAAGAAASRYNALFQFLLRLKRVQMHLEQAWQQLGRWGYMCWMLVLLRSVLCCCRAQSALVQLCNHGITNMYGCCIDMTVNTACLGLTLHHSMSSALSQQLCNFLFPCTQAGRMPLPIITSHPCRSLTRLLPLQAVPVR